MEKEIMTVSDLFDICKNLIDNGYGNMVIECLDETLHKDEISIFYPGDGKLQLRGRLFHQNLTAKTFQLQEDIKNAIDKFYETN